MIMQDIFDADQRIEWPDGHSDVFLARTRVSASAGFDESEPRDESGKWTEGGGDSSAKEGDKAESADEKSPDKVSPKKPLTLEKAKAILDKFPGAKAIRTKAAAIHKKLVQRYGAKTAGAIVASGQAISWGAFGVGAAVGVPVWIPSVAAMVPAAAIAELRYRFGKKVAAAAGESDEELTKEQIDKLADELVRELEEEWETMPEREKEEAHAV